MPRGYVESVMGSFSFPDLGIPKFLAIMLLFIPLSIVAEFMHWSPVSIFILSALAIIPLAGVMGAATEELAIHSGPTVGGLLNATFGNMAEIIIALFAIKAGLFDVVKATLTGSIIGNILLVLGLSMFMGGIKFKKLEFNRHVAGMNSLMLVLACVGLILPAMVVNQVSEPVINNISLIVAGLLILVYLAGLLFSFVTHSHLFNPAGHEEHEGAEWSLKRSIVILLISSAFVALASEFLVGSVEEAAHALGLTDLFVGVIVLAIIGNAAEHSSAIMMAMKNKMDLSFSIAVNSSTQIALFAAPALVFVSYLLGNPMDLVFSQLEILAITLSVIVVYMASLDGRCNWFEGLQLLMVYAILGVIFFFIPG